MKTLLVISLLLASCGGQPNIDNPIKSKPQDPDYYLIRLNYDPDNWLSVDYQSDAALTDDLSLSLSIANQSAANSYYAAGGQASTGAAVAGGIIGSLLAIAISGSITDSKIKNAAEEPIKPFLENKTNQTLQTKLSDTLSEQLSSVQMPLALIKKESLAEDYDGTTYPLEIKPTIILSRNYSLLKLSLNISLFDPNTQTIASTETKNANIIYQNTINYYIIPDIYSPETAKEMPTYWNNIELSIINGYIEEAIPALTTLFIEDFNQHQKKSRLLAHHPIKIKNSIGEYYERGRLIQENENRVTYYTLRHEIKSIPGTLLPKIY
jgi:hypothetical protein